jgi:hypothetical protein
MGDNMSDDIIVVQYNDEVAIIETDLTYDQLKEKIKEYAVYDNDSEEINFHETLYELENNGYLTLRGGCEVVIWHIDSLI